MGVNCSAIDFTISPKPVTCAGRDSSRDCGGESRDTNRKKLRDSCRRQTRTPIVIGRKPDSQWPVIICTAMDRTPRPLVTIYVLRTYIIYIHLCINPYIYIMREYVYLIYLCILYVYEKKYPFRGFREYNYIVIHPSIPSRYKLTQSKRNQKTKISV